MNKVKPMYKVGNILKNGDLFVIVNFENNDPGGHTFVGTVLTDGSQDSFCKESCWKLSSLKEAYESTNE